jgi:hypothetical protein
LFPEPAAAQETLSIPRRWGQKAFHDLVCVAAEGGEGFSAMLCLKVEFQFTDADGSPCTHRPPPMPPTRSNLGAAAKLQAARALAHQGQVYVPRHLTMPSSALTNLHRHMQGSWLGTGSR